jgi:hypothetical protein
VLAALTGATLRLPTGAGAPIVERASFPP